MAGKGKELQAVVNLAGSIDPSLGKAIESAQKKISGLNVKALAVGAAVGGIAVATGKAVVEAGKYLKDQDPNVKVVAVEPDTSPVLSTGKGGPHKIQGIGAGFVPDVLDTKVYDEVIRVANEDAFETSRQFAHSEGLFVGISSGAALWAAVELSKRPENAGKVIVALLPDTGDRYLSTPLVSE